MSILRMKLYIIVLPGAPLPIGLYDTFEAAKAHVDRLTLASTYASIFMSVVNDPTHAIKIYDNL